jgi:hypothetical protein
MISQKSKVDPIIILAILKSSMCKRETKLKYWPISIKQENMKTYIGETFLVNTPIKK